MTTNKLSKIAFIIPYFGKLPNYFNFWLESCRHNPTIDWFVFTDDKTKYDYPPNIKVTYTTFSEIKKKFQNKFDFNISLEFIYKFTDFKPTYGVVFNEYIKDYDFWGFCDVDLIFGNIRNFITEDILTNNEKIMANGHFCLIKNNSKFNNLFRDTINGKEKYKEVYTTNKHFGFDEYGTEAFHSICKKNNLKIYTNSLIFADINSYKKHFVPTYVRSLAKKEEIRSLKWDEENQKHSSIFEFNKGKLIRHFIKNKIHAKREYLYVHFQKRKMLTDTNEKVNDTFLMVPSKFINNNTEINISIIQKYGKKRFFSNRRLKRQIRVKVRMFIKNNFGI